MLRRMIPIAIGIKRCIAASLLFVIMLPPVHAAPHKFQRPPAMPKASPRLSVGDAVSIALAQNLRVKKQLLSMEQRAQERRAAASDFFPSVALEYSANVDRYQNLGYIYQLVGRHPGRWMQRGAGSSFTPLPSISGQTAPRGFTNLYPYRIDPYKNFQFTAVLTQPLYKGGQLTNSQQNADLAVAGSVLDMEILRQDMTLEVICAYYQLVLNKRMVRIAEESVKYLTAFKKKAQALFKVGEGLKLDVKAAEAHLVHAKAEKTKALTAVATSMSQLNFLLGFSQATEIAVDEEIKYRPSLYRVPEIYEIALANRTEIRRADISAEQARAAVRIAEANRLPGVDLQLQGYRVNDDWNVFDPEGTNDWSVQATLTWAFDLCRTSATIQRQRAASDQSFVEKQYLIQQVLQQVQAAFLNVRRQETDVKQYKEAIAARREQLSMARALYDRKMKTYLDVIDAQSGLNQAQGNYFSALAGLAACQAQLERQMGILDNPTAALRSSHQAREGK